MNLKIISWNVRGLNDRDKRLRVRNLVRKWGLDVICLQKTKMELITRAVIRSLWDGQHVDSFIFRFLWCFWRGVAEVGHAGCG